MKDINKSKKTRSSRQASIGSKQMSFLPEPDFNPSIPKMHTNHGKCLRMLLAGRHLTHPDFERETGSWRLAIYIDDLKDMGWPIYRDDIGYHTSLAHNIRSIASYYLSRDVINKAKKMGVCL